jgi:hypothetical protein
MEDSLNGLGLGSKNSFVNNNNVSKLNVNKLNLNINKKCNHLIKSENNVQNEKTIECIDLKDSSDSDTDVEPPNKMARLSPLNSPLTSIQPNLNDSHMKLIHQKDININENKIQIKDNLIETEKCDNCFDRLLETNERLMSDPKVTIDSFNTSIANQCIQSNGSNESDESLHKTDKTFNQKLNFDIKTQNIDSNENLIKQLIGLCVEKRFEKQTNGFKSEENLIEKIETLEKESIRRNNELILVKSAHELKSKVILSDKQIQVNPNCGQNNIEEENCLKLNESLTLETNSNANNESTNNSILKEHLMSRQNNYNSIETQLKNGLKFKLEKDLKISKNTSNNIGMSESTTCAPNQTNSLANNCLINDNNDKSGDDCEVVTIDSDEEEPNESVEQLKTTGLSLKSSHFNKALPQPQLSVSYSKSNKTNNSLITKGQNTSTERKSKFSINLLSPTENGRQSCDTDFIELD